MSIGELYSRIGMEKAPSAAAAKPLLALMLETFGRLPAEEESFLYQCFEITVETVENDCPTFALVHMLSDEDLAEHAAAEKEVEA